jgi:rare lipoprotein A (peptidoglycan hydrolase)
MRKRRQVLPFIMLCLCTFAAHGQQSQQSWQGNAAVARSGEFAAPGLYAASNAFPENTAILVQNAQTGQSVRVTVTRRIRGTASIFLLLSEEAGQQIGLTGSQVIRVRANVVGTPDTDLGDSLREEAYSNDPDLNPAVSVTEEQLLSGPAEAEAAVVEEPVEIAQAAPPEPEPEAEASAEEAEAAEAPPVVEAEQPAELAEEAEQEPPEIAEKPAAAPAAAAATPEEKRLQELADRIPQKQLYMPPRQQEVYALAPEPGPSEEAEEEIAAAEQHEEEVEEAEEQLPTEVIAEAEEELPEELPEEVVEVVEEGPPRVSMVEPEAEEEPLEVALPGPEAAEPEKPSPEGTRLPAPAEETPLTVAPEEPPTGEIEKAVAAEEVVEQPVEQAAVAEEEQPVAEVATAEAAAEEPAGLSETLPARTYFVQLGAYSTRTLAEKLAGDLTQSYSVTILPASSGGRRFYKVLVGPLNVDESGTLLYQFRSRGFKDAFIQYVE